MVGLWPDLDLVYEIVSWSQYTPPPPFQWDNNKTRWGFSKSNGCRVKHRPVVRVHGCRVNARIQARPHPSSCRAYTRQRPYNAILIIACFTYRAGTNALMTGHLREALYKGDGEKTDSHSSSFHM